MLEMLEEEDRLDVVLLVELLMAVLLGAAVLELEAWLTTLGSEDGIGFPSLVCNFTTCRNKM